MVVFNLVLVGVLFFVAEAVGSKGREAGKLGFPGAVAVGLAQATALVPGVSRSGGTITFGLLMGYTREAAARYSFLLAVPAVFGSGLFQLVKSYDELGTAGTPGGVATLVATVISFVVGYVVIIGFLKLVSTRSYWPFVWYRLALAAAVAFVAPRDGLTAVAVVVDHGLQPGSVDVAARAAQQCRALGLTADSTGFTPIDQELGADQPLEDALHSITWPEGVAGCAAVVERLVLPPSADDELPDDREAAASYAAEHPDRQELRMVAAATRGGATYCAYRFRSHDDPASVVTVGSPALRKWSSEPEVSPCVGGRRSARPMSPAGIRA